MTINKKLNAMDYTYFIAGVLLDQAFSMFVARVGGDAL